MSRIAHREVKTMYRSPNTLALTMKDAARLVGVDYRTIKLGIESGTIPTVQLGQRRMIPRAGLLRAFGVDA
jgi:excisionase family DNA binding protein